MIKTLKKITTIATITSGLLLTACGKAPESNVLKIGAMAGPEAEIIEIAKNIAKEKYNLDVDQHY